MKQFGFIPILIIILIAASLFGAYYLGKSSLKQQTAQPTPQPSTSPVTASPVPNGTGDMTNWKTYTNTKYGFSFRHPNDLTLKTDDFEDSLSIQIGDLIISIMTKNYDKNHHIGISRVEYERALSGAQLNVVFSDPETKRKFIKVGEKMIGGQNFTIFKVQAISDVKDSSLSESYGVDIVGAFADNLFRFLPIKTNVINDQILSTFKFTDQNTYTCPASEYVNCMPTISQSGPSPKNPQCSQDYLTWAKTNCPNFKGAAY